MNRSPEHLQRSFERILSRSDEFGAGGKEVLETAYHVLAAGRAIGRWPTVGLEDLWAHAIKEGRGLFNNPSARWGKTGPRETKDMIGQTTIGPWQITVQNVKQQYGLPYGLSPRDADADVFARCQANPQIQAGMICDYIAESYGVYGRRSPLAIQRYFWLEAFVKGEIGQGAWEASVLPTAPDGDWRKLTPQIKADTGFYAKQILLGTKSSPHGLLWWLWVTGSHDEITETLRTWRDAKQVRWDGALKRAIETDAPGGFTIVADDLKYIPDHAARMAIEQVALF